MLSQEQNIKRKHYRNFGNFERKAGLSEDENNTGASGWPCKNKTKNQKSTTNTQLPFAA